jgi:broad specificity phosphatase PhoE
MSTRTLQKSTTVYLTRHGQSEWNGKKRVSGQLNPALSQKGQQQSRSLAQILSNKPLSSIYTSTLTRAIATCRPTAVDHHLPIRIRRELKEIRTGVLQGRFRDQRDPEAQRLWDAWQQDKDTYRIPGGESFSELTQRVIPCVKEILEQEQGGTVLIVGHRNTNRVILGALTQWPRDKWCELNPRSKYLYEIIPGVLPEIKTIALWGRDSGRVFEEFKV